MTKLHAFTTFAVTALAIVLGGCGGHGEHSESMATGTDSAFVADMVPHHEAAIDMARIAERRASHPEVKALAASIIKAQQSEIDQMHGMGGGEHGSMDGMHMSDADMGMDMDPAELETAMPFDKAFLEMMIPHHEGAIRMAEAELADGKDAETQALAKAIIAAQRKEIAAMRAWLRDWYG